MNTYFEGKFSSHIDLQHLFYMQKDMLCISGHASKIQEFIEFALDFKDHFLDFYFKRDT